MGGCFSDISESSKNWRRSERFGTEREAEYETAGGSVAGRKKVDRVGDQKFGAPKASQPEDTPVC